MTMSAIRHLLPAAVLLALLGCRPSAARCAECGGTAVVAAIGEPNSILPPLVYETVGRDIGDLIFERLADLKAGGSPVDTEAFVPRLFAELGVGITSVAVSRPTLDDVFMRYTGSTIRDAETASAADRNREMARVVVKAGR